jgi:hypothetical protein
MASKRDNLYPPTSSIGRAQGTQIARAASFETLSTHPLLSTTSTTASSTSSTPPAQGPGLTPPDGLTTTQTIPPKYIPYTPRHRVAATAATTTDASSISVSTPASASVSASAPHLQGGATTKLQLMNLKAAAQSAGVETTSVGWTMLEKIVYHAGESNSAAEWNDIWTSITSGKVLAFFPFFLSYFLVLMRRSR